MFKITTRRKKKQKYDKRKTRQKLIIMTISHVRHKVNLKLLCLQLLLGVKTTKRREKRK